MKNLDLLISQQEIQAKIAQISEQLDQDYAGKELTIVMVMKGALCLVADLIRQIHFPCKVEFVAASSYGARGTQRGELTLRGLEQINIRHQHVLVVDDIFDTGVTLSQVVTHLQQMGPASLKSLVLLSKKGASRSAYQPDYILFDIDNHFVVGYGLDYKELYRGLSGVHILRDGL